MKALIDENGVCHTVPANISGHYKYLIQVLKMTPEEANTIPSKWVSIRDWDSCTNDTMAPLLKYRNRYAMASYTDRPKYTLGQLDWLKEHNAYIDTSKL